MTKVGGIVSGQKVLVVGLGAVGTFAGLTARLSGCGELDGIDPIEPKRLRSRSVFDSTYASLSDLMGHEKAQRLSHDLIIDTSGDTSTINQLIEFAPGSARIILVGMPRDSTYPILPVQKMLDGLTISGSNGGEVDPKIDFARVTSLYQNSLERERPILASVLPGDALAQALSGFHEEPALRIILDLGALGS